MTAEVDVAIVGAGAAGIAAARRLASSGLSSLVLEASASVGGRAWTQTIDGLPLDLGCEWLHSADRNLWARIAEESGVVLNRKPPPWDAQFADLGFSPSEQAAAHKTFANWVQNLHENPPVSDCAAHALDPGGEWNAFIRANVSYISGVELERLSVADYAAYDEASTGANWRVPVGFGALIASSLPRGAHMRLSTSVESLALTSSGVTLATARGDLRARAVILTVSTAVLAGGTLALPTELEAWRAAAARLPLGRNEKVFLRIVGESAFEPDTHAFGDPRDAATGSYLIRPYGWPVIECYLGGIGADMLAEEGLEAGFARAANQLASLFGADIRRALRPLAATGWSKTSHIGGAYSSALPGQASARLELARAFDGRIFFAGEATHQSDFSTAHGAYATGLRAAEEAIAALAPVGRP